MMRKETKRRLYALKSTGAVVAQSVESTRAQAPLGRLPSTILTEASQVFCDQAKALLSLAHRVNEDYTRALQMLLATRGHVVIFGVGKSGLIGKKIAATWASTGTPSFFVHAGEAYHGDLGMITERDTALMISYSGETEEAVRLVPHLRKLNIPIIALVGSMKSTLACAVDIALDVSVEKEACPNNLAPTHSTLATLAMGDALAVSMMRQRDFRAQDFARFHPGGRLGQRLCTHVRDVMKTDDLPMVDPSTTVGESLVTMTSGRLGLVLVMQRKRLIGLMTDGDLRRGMQRFKDVLSVPVAEIMTMNPVAIEESTLIEDARIRMKKMKLKAFVVKNSNGDVVGVIDLFDEK